VRHTIRWLTVHHPAVKLTRNRDAPQRMRNHQAYHQSLGWPDIAYHLGIDRHGHVYELRPRWAKGDTNTDYDPRGHLLVLCEGDFDVQQPSAHMVTALVDVLAWGCLRYDVPVHRIKGHRDHAATSCPGQSLCALIQSGAIRRRVEQRLDARGARLREVCGPAGRALVEAIESGHA
jgi:N-acetylmuramoyl-L-alanine amidase